MDISRRIDWLQYTHHEIDKWTERIPFSKADEIGGKINPLPNYNRAFALMGGGRVDISNNSHQGVQVTLGGQAVTEWIIAGAKFQDIIRQVVSYSKVVRLDFATDIKQSPYAGDEIFWKEIQTLVANDAYKSRLKPSNEISGKKKKEGGYTQYFGSYKSDQFIRVYDKNAESGLLLEAMKQHLTIDHWSRIELVTKRDFAHNLAADMAYGGWQQAGTAKLRKMIDFPLSDTWKKIIDGISVELTQVGRKPDRWRKWMDTSVMQSILKHAENQEDKEFILKWIQVLVANVWDVT